MRLLITGGAGFIGTNTVKFFLPRSKKIYVLDSFVRSTSRKNADYLENLSKKIMIVPKKITDKKCIKTLIQQVDVVIHLAAQVAVTTSLQDPQTDFDTNVVGSFNILEAARRYNPKAILLYASTNKVYGDLKKVKIDRTKGIDESAPIDLYSPYGCSKGAADLYFLDYARSFGLKTIVFRQSCVYGPHQYGKEDQGWLAHFVLRILKEEQIIIYGTGKQVRDLLYINDLVRLYDMAIKKINKVNKVKGQAFNVGGGPANAASLLEAIKLIEEKTGKKARLKFTKKRLGDQDYFVSNNSKAKKILGWQPKININKGLDKLILWCQQNS